MKKLFIACITTLCIAVSASAQKKSGAIQFETTMDPAVMASASGMQIPPEMLARMPKSAKTNFELLFTPTNASYMPVEDAEDSNGGGGGGMNMGRMMMRFGGGGGNREYFYSFADKKISEVFDMNDTTFVMPGKLQLSTSGPLGSMNLGGNNNNNANNNGVQYKNEPPVVEVVKTNETKTILGFKCNKAIVKSTRKIKILDMDKEVTEETALWYTNDLGFEFSPNTNMWTEGAVLAIEGRGSSTIAKSIEYRSVSTKDVTAPKKGVSITAEEYQVKMENMMKRMRGNGTGGARTGQPGAVRSIVIN
ncbi:MAG: hypothetical protein EOP48_21620 [Sphingobacteriales bacterium]|nr:MAG: hypothetical protein EOP48_21620 [Sphingobacteriales bacterium]